MVQTKDQPIDELKKDQHTDRVKMPDAQDPEAGRVFSYISTHVKPSWLLSLAHFGSAVGGLYVLFLFYAASRRAAFDELFNLFPFPTFVKLAFQLAVIVIYSGIVVRLFMIFHDCGHDAFTPSRRANDILGTLVGCCLVETPYSYWKKGHTYHHQHSNNLDYHQLSQTAPWSAEQWQKASPAARLIYKIGTHPYATLLVTPVLFFLLYHPYLHLKSLMNPSRGRAHEAMVFFVANFCILALSPPYFAELLYLAQIVGSITGVFLFHAQHTFDGAKRYRSENWSYYRNGIYGSSFIQIPWFLKWVTFGIEYHFIHHLNAKVPCYRLQKCFETAPPDIQKVFAKVPKVTLADAFKTLKYQVYDEKMDTLMSLGS